MIAVDTTKSLDQLDGQDWGPPNFDSYVVTSCHRLRKKPLREFEAEDFRVLLGQSVSLEYLVPAALTFLRQHPFAGGHFHPGSVLERLLLSDARFWSSRPDLRIEAEIIATEALHRIAEVDEEDRPIAFQGISEAYAAFKAKGQSQRADGA